MPLQLSRPSRPAIIGLTPLIDVVFILLLFFMLATNFQRWRAVDIDAVNTAGEAAPSARKLLLVRVGASDVDVAGESISLVLLGVEIQKRLARSPNVEVMVSALDEAPVQKIVSVMDILRDSGIRQAQFSVQ